MYKKYPEYLALFNLRHSGTFQLTLVIVGRENSAVLKQGPKRHKPLPIQKVMRSHEKVMRKS